MSVKEILEQVETLTEPEQNQVAAFLTHLRHKKDPSFYQRMADRAAREDASSWICLEEPDEPNP